MNYAAVLSGLPDAVVAVDRARRVVFWNTAAEELTGRSAPRALGRPMADVLPSGGSLVRGLEEAFTTGQRRAEPEATLAVGPGRGVPVSLVTAPLFGSDGGVEAAVAVLRDATRVRQLEAEVRRGEALATAGRMALGLAHEIRNPLGAIRGAVQLLAREFDGDARVGPYVDVVVKEVGRLDRLLEQLLDLGRPMRLQLAPLNIHQLLERVLLLHEEAARAQGVELVRRYDPSLPPILGDEDRLVQVLHNLVRNALEALPGPGRVTLATGISLDPLGARLEPGERPHPLVEVRVADDGPGISDDVRSRLFDPLFTTKARGLGLGLAISHRILEEHHGSIHVESAPGAGAVVTCLVPVAR